MLIPQVHTLNKPHTKFVMVTWLPSLAKILATKNTADEMADLRETINYEVVCNFARASICVHLMTVTLDETGQAVDCKKCPLWGNTHQHCVCGPT